MHTAPLRLAVRGLRSLQPCALHLLRGMQRGGRHVDVPHLPHHSLPGVCSCVYILVCSCVLRRLMWYVCLCAFVPSRCLSRGPTGWRFAAFAVLRPWLWGTLQDGRRHGGGRCCTCMLCVGVCVLCVCAVRVCCALCACICMPAPCAVCRRMRDTATVTHTHSLVAHTHSTHKEKGTVA